MHAGIKNSSFKDRNIQHTFTQKGKPSDHPALALPVTESVNFPLENILLPVLPEKISGWYLRASAAVCSD